MTDETPERPLTLSELYAELARRVGDEAAHALVALYNLELLQEQASPLIPVDPFTLEFADQMHAWTHLLALLSLDQPDLEEVAASAPGELRAKKRGYRSRDN